MSATITPDQEEILREAGEAWLDWSVPGAWITVDPATRPLALVEAERLVEGGALVRDLPGGRRFRLSTKSRLALAAALAPQGKAGAVLKRPLDGRRRVRRKGSR